MTSSRVSRTSHSRPRQRGKNLSRLAPELQEPEQRPEQAFAALGGCTGPPGRRSHGAGGLQTLT